MKLIMVESSVRCISLRVRFVLMMVGLLLKMGFYAWRKKMECAIKSLKNVERVFYEDEI